MKPFIIIAVLLITAGAYVLIAGVVQVVACLEAGTWSLDVWTPEFWLLVPGEAAAGLGPNGKWFVRLGGGVVLIVIGRIVLRVAR